MTGAMGDVVALVTRLALLAVAPLLPERPRQRVASRFGLDLHAAAVASGLVEVAASIVLFDVGYRATMAVWTEQQLALLGENADSVTSRAPSPFWNPVNVAIYSGPLNLVAFLLTPQGAIPAYMFFEGVLRAGLSAASGECVGSGLLVAPHALVLRLLAAGRARLATVTALPPRPDRVRALRGRHGGGLLVDTDTPRDGFERDAAVWVEGQVYRLARRRVRREGRRHLARYLLRPWPPGAAMRKQVRLHLRAPEPGGASGPRAT